MERDDRRSGLNRGDMPRLFSSWHVRGSCQFRGAVRLGPSWDGQRDESSGTTGRRSHGTDRSVRSEPSTERFRNRSRARHCLPRKAVHARRGHHEPEPRHNKDSRSSLRSNIPPSRGGKNWWRRSGDSRRWAPRISVGCKAGRRSDKLNAYFLTPAGMAELADAADSKSAEVHPSWGFNSPSRHQQFPLCFE